MNLNEIKKATNSAIDLIIFMEEKGIEEKFNSLKELLKSNDLQIEDKIFSKDVFLGLLNRKLKLCNKYISRAEELSITI